MFPMEKNKLLFFLFLTTYFNFINLKGIVFPFKTEPINIESSKYIEAIKENKIYITTNIGKKPQTIKLYLTMDFEYLLISDSSIDSSYFNSKKSQTYLITSELKTFYLEVFSKGYFANDSFIFQISFENENNNTFNNIEFIHVLEYSNNNYISSGYFGLQIPRPNKKSIINCLYKIDAISSYNIYFKYTSDSEGFLSIGEFPSEYSQKKLKMTNALPCQTDTYTSLCWFLKFNDINFGDIKVNRDRTATISPELGFIIGSEEFRIKIRENYFEKFLNDKCKEKISENNYNYFECDKNADISTFKDLIFTHQELMFHFVLTKDDLFKVYGDKLYFLIVFDKYSYHGKNWRLGKPFLKKYNFLYNIENKIIYFYDNNTHENFENPENINTIYWIIIGILFFGVIVMITLVSIKFVLEPKKNESKDIPEDNRNTSLFPENENHA